MLYNTLVRRRTIYLQFIKIYDDYNILDNKESDIQFQFAIFYISLTIYFLMLLGYNNKFSPILYKFPIVTLFRLDLAISDTLVYRYS